MNLILLAAQSSPDLATLFPQRHTALLPVAGSPLLGHALDLLAEATPARWLVTVGEHAAEMTSWLAARPWTSEPRVIALGEPAGLLSALSRSRDYLPGNEPLLIVPAGGVLKADWSRLDNSAVALVDGEVACALFVPRAEWLWTAVNGLMTQPAAPTLGDLARALQKGGTPVATQAVIQWEDASTPAGLLRANKRLLSVGYGSREALERSFAEGFTVLPPIFLADTAEVSSAVLGPYVSVGEGAVIEDAILRNSIIAPGARVSGCVLDGAIVGRNSQITGRLHELRAGDNSQISLG